MCGYANVRMGGYADGWMSECADVGMSGYADGRDAA